MHLNSKFIVNMNIIRITALFGTLTAIAILSMAIEVQAVDVSCDLQKLAAARSKFLAYACRNDYNARVEATLGDEIMKISIYKVKFEIMSLLAHDRRSLSVRGGFVTNAVSFPIGFENPILWYYDQFEVLS